MLNQKFAKSVAMQNIGRSFQSMGSWQEIGYKGLLGSYSCGTLDYCFKEFVVNLDQVADYASGSDLPCQLFL